MFFSEIEEFELLMDGEFDELDAAGKRLWNLELASVWEAPPSDLDLWERYGLPWVEGNRCPVVCRLGPGEIERPDRRQLAFLEGLLSALAATAEAEIDSGRWRKRVATSEGPMDFALSLPALLEPVEIWPVEPALSWRADERSLRDIGKLLQAREFGSLEEANAALARFVEEGSPRAEPETPEEQAEELMDLAWDMPGRRAVLLARRALETWPDCADAYNLLAGRAVDPETARELYERGVAAGERAVGPETFSDEAGRFWGILETRPYMRARPGARRIAGGAGALRRGGGALSGHAAPQSQRQPGRAGLVGERAHRRGPGRGGGGAARAVPGGFHGEDGLPARPVGVPPRRRFLRGPPLSETGAAGERVRAGPAARHAEPSAAFRRLCAGERGRGHALFHRLLPDLEDDPRRAGLAAVPDQAAAQTAGTQTRGEAPEEEETATVRRVLIPRSPPARSRGVRRIRQACLVH